MSALGKEKKEKNIAWKSCIRNVKHECQKRGATTPINGMVTVNTIKSHRVIEKWNST